MHNVCLGKREPKRDPRTLELANYLRADRTPAPPASTNWRAKAGKLGMLLNDRIGSCGPAGALHTVQAWVNCDGGSFAPTDQQCLEAYSALSGYDPRTGKNDNGVYLLDMNNYWVKVGIGGYKLGAYARLKPQNHGQVLDTVNLFGGFGAGWALPKAWKGAKVWTAPTGPAAGAWQPGSWGGHYAPVIDYDPTYLYVMSWGSIIPVEWKAYDLYCDEAYALFAEAWFGNDLVAPNGFDWSALASDYAEVTGRPAPPSPQPPTPPLPPSGKVTITLSGSGKSWTIDSIQ